MSEEIEGEIIKTTSTDIVKTCDLHDSNGKFKKGNPGNPKGNPNFAKIQKFRNAIYKAETIDQIKSVWNRLREEALSGGKQAVAAQTLYLKYMLGEPQKNIAITVDQLSDEERKKRIDELFGVEEV